MILVNGKTMLKIGNKYYRPGQEIKNAPENIEKRLINAGMAQKKKVKDQEKQSEPVKDTIKHVGGGWYEVKGQKVQGKEEAMKLLDN